MKFLIAVVANVVCCAVAEYFLPWWMIAVVPFLVSLFAGQRPGGAFMMGFVGVGVFWLAAALMQDGANNHILSTRMAALFQLPGYGAYILVTAFLGALIGGMSACAGALIKGETKSPTK